MENNELQEYVFICAKIKELEAAKKKLEESLKESITDKTVCEWYTVSKVTSNKTVLKEWTELSQLVERFGGGAIKQEANIKYLQTVPEAFEFMELKETSYLKVTKNKDV